MAAEPPRRGGDKQHIDTQLNKLFAFYHDAEFAEIKGDTRQARSLVADGLAQSCALMRQLRDIDVLQSVTPSKDIRKLLGNKALIERFLRVERELLKRTKLDEHVAEYLIEALQVLLMSKKELPVAWKSDLELFIQLVCSEAKKASTMLRPPALLNRAILAGGGGLVALLNLAPMLGVPLPSDLVPLSSTAGVWLIAEAAKDQIAAFLGKPK